LKVVNFEFQLRTKGEIEVIDITSKIRELVRNSGVRNGVVIVFVPGSTAAISTIEFESNLIEDFKELLSKLAEKGGWRHPINAHSHLRATLLSPSITVPIVDGELTLGVWQQIVFIELDTRPRNRRVIVQVIGTT